jgi:hypothetical protein
VTVWVTGEQILVQAGAVPATPADETWAALCASAVSQGIDVRLEGVDVIDPPEAGELTRAALVAGVEAYKARETSYVDQQATINRIAGDYLSTIAPIIARYATVGLA